MVRELGSSALLRFSLGNKKKADELRARREPKSFTKATAIRAAVPREKMGMELEAQAEEETAHAEGIESSQKGFKRRDNYRSIRVGLNSLFKTASLAGILNSSQGMMSHWVLTPPLACPNGCTGNPELHNIQTSSVSIRSPLNLNMHYFGKRTYFISRV